jgi:hypothetical protein
MFLAQRTLAGIPASLKKSKNSQQNIFAAPQNMARSPWNIDILAKNGASKVR